MYVLSSQEVADHLDCTKRNVIRLVHAGELEPINPGHKSYMFFKGDVDELAKKRKKRKEVQNA